MNNYTVSRILVLLLFCLFFSTETIHAKKWNFTSGRGSGKKPRVMKSFITNTNNVKSARRISTRVRRGQKIYFYYKIGPVKVKKGKGAPYRTRLVIKKGRRLVKDFGWHNANAAGPGQRGKTGTFSWFHNSKWYLKISKKVKPGNYNAEITHRDQNSGKTLKIRYHFSIVR